MTGFNAIGVGWGQIASIKKKHEEKIMHDRMLKEGLVDSVHNCPIEERRIMRETIDKNFRMTFYYE